MNDKKIPLTEIVNQIGKDVKNVGHALKKAAITAGTLGLDFVASCAILSTLPYVTPTTVVSLYNARGEFESDHPGQGAAFGIGCLLGAVGYVLQYQGYKHALQEGHPEIFIPILATNIASGLYEWRKSAKSRLEVKNDVLR